jgi:hypothetical protein
MVRRDDHSRRKMQNVHGDISVVAGVPWSASKRSSTVPSPRSTPRGRSGASRADLTTTRAAECRMSVWTAPKNPRGQTPALAYEPGGRTFESCWAHQINNLQRRVSVPEPVVNNWFATVSPTAHRRKSHVQKSAGFRADRLAESREHLVRKQMVLLAFDGATTCCGAVCTDDLRFLGRVVARRWATPLSGLGS